MLGKIFEKDNLKIIYNYVIKTSDSGLFTNRRLAVLFILQAKIGYLTSKQQKIAQDAITLQSCKQVFSIRDEHFSYEQKAEDRNILLLRWGDQKQRIWEFKFESQKMAQQWSENIRLILEPPKPQIKVDEVKDKPALEENKVDFSRMKQSSRFILNQANQKSPQDDKQQRQQLKGQAYNSNEVKKNVNQIEQQKYIIPSKSNRFKAQIHEQKLHQNQMDNLFPTIQTFREKFPPNTVFNSINRKANKLNKNPDNTKNWNLEWYAAIEKEQQHVRIGIYDRFLQGCEVMCRQLIQELTFPKNKRKYSPERITMNEEVYTSNGISFHLMINRELDDQKDLLGSCPHRKKCKAIMENYAFILKATRNKGIIRVPLACLFQLWGFSIYCEALIPSNFIQVDHAEKYIFYPQINRLEGQLHIRINLSYIDLFTDKIQAIVEQSRNKNHFLIISNIKKLLPQQSDEFGEGYMINGNFLLESKETYTRDKSYSQQKQKWINNLIRSQNKDCTIISYEDLKQTFNSNYVSISNIPQILIQSDNKYIHKILINQIVSQLFCNLVRNTVMQIAKQSKINHHPQQKHLHNQEEERQPEYSIFIFRLIQQLLHDGINAKSKIWNIITQKIFQDYSIAIKVSQIIVGYLVSSISLKLGINFDYHLLFLHKQYYFTEHALIPQQSIISFTPIFLKYKNQQICESYDCMMRQIEGSQQKQLDSIVEFYNMRKQRDRMQPELLKKICRYFSFYVPYQKQQQYEFMNIYGYLNLVYLDYKIFTIMISAIKWLLHANRIIEAMEFVNYFKGIAWFWVGDNNPFTIIIYQILGEYHKVTFDLIESINYFTLVNDANQQNFKGGAELMNVNRNFQLAQMFMACNLHKEALNKFRQVKKIFSKNQRESSVVLGIIVQIAKLYLHLGDVERCLKSCKSAIQFSILQPFSDDLQQYQVFVLFLRAFQIKQQPHKYKFYLDMIEDKFQSSQNSIILQGVLRFTMQNILQGYKSYRLKKTAFILYNFQKNKKNQIEYSLQELLTILIKSIKSNLPCKILRECMEKNLQIADLMADKLFMEVSVEDTKQIEALEGQASLLELFCDFIGYEYILGVIASLLKKK